MRAINQLRLLRHLELVPMLFWTAHILEIEVVSMRDTSLSPYSRWRDTSGLIRTTDLRHERRVLITT